MSADRYSSELIQEVRKLSSIEHPFTVTKPGTSHGREVRIAESLVNQLAKYSISH